MLVLTFRFAPQLPGNSVKSETQVSEFRSMVSIVSIPYSFLLEGLFGLVLCFVFLRQVSVAQAGLDLL